MCACAQRTGAPACKSLRRDRPGGSYRLCSALAAAPVLFVHATITSAIKVRCLINKSRGHTCVINQQRHAQEEHKYDRTINIVHTGALSDAIGAAGTKAGRLASSSVIKRSASAKSPAEQRSNNRSSSTAICTPRDMPSAQWGWLLYQCQCVCMHLKDWRRRKRGA